MQRYHQLHRYYVANVLHLGVAGIHHRMSGTPKDTHPPVEFFDLFGINIFSCLDLSSFFFSGVQP